jgi:hypothetical protein
MVQVGVMGHYAELARDRHRRVKGVDHIGRDDHAARQVAGVSLQPQLHRGLIGAEVRAVADDDEAIDLRMFPHPGA